VIVLYGKDDEVRTVLHKIALLIDSEGHDELKESIEYMQAIKLLPSAEELQQAINLHFKHQNVIEAINQLKRTLDA